MEMYAEAEFILSRNYISSTYGFLCFLWTCMTNAQRHTLGSLNSILNFLLQTTLSGVIATENSHVEAKLSLFLAHGKSRGRLLPFVH